MRALKPKIVFQRFTVLEPQAAQSSKKQANYDQKYVAYLAIPE
jgi:hypothetical protein